MRKLLMLLIMLPLSVFAANNNQDLFEKLCKESKDEVIRQNYCKLAKEQKQAMAIYGDFKKAQKA